MLSGGFRTVSALRPAFPLHATRAKVRLFDFTSVSLITDTIDVSSSVSLIADTADTIDVSSSVSLDALGRDLFTFLAASVIVVPISKQLGITPVLGFLALGCAIGPYGLELFSDSEADIELGDFGIVFLLFIEGLNLSSDRVQKLGSFFQLGLAQFLFSIGAFFFSTLLIGPQLLPAVEAFIPLDDTLLRPILSSPVEAFCIASAGALSSSAFVLPVLKQKGWEERADGTAALAILLLQDIAVAPLLVILPLVAGSGPQGGLELGILVAKGTFGFGAVLAAGSVVLRQIFSVVAATRSSETFVAAALLVAVGMGWAADALGLSTTTGAFAAGVLLAGSQYRAQIEADIKPFEGILLGVFFMTAGANLDPGLCLQEWPTLLTGIVAFIGVKAAIIFAAGEFALGLTRAESVRIGLLLAGGGEFAFVIFKLSEDLGVLPDQLAKLLTASVIISMSLTPILGEAAAALGDAIDDADVEAAANARADGLFDAIDVDANGSVSMAELRSYLLGGGAAATLQNTSFEDLFTRLDLNGDGVISREELREGYVELCMGEARDAALRDATSEPAVESGERATAPDAVVVCGYGEMGQRACEVLASAEGVRKGGEVWGTEYIAFDRNPSRVSMGLGNNVRVVYGDGASPELLSAAGVRAPRAIVITYANDKRCLEATRRLREAFPSTPIYVRSRVAQEGEALLEAGATEVVVEAVEAAVRFSELLGVETDATDSLLRALPAERSAGSVAPYTDDQMTGLASECGLSVTEVRKLYDVFSTLDADDDGEVGLSELRDMLMRMSITPIDDEALSMWMADADEDGGGTLSFEEYVRISAKSTSLPEPTI